MRKDVSIHEREEVFEVDGEDRPWVCEGQTVQVPGKKGWRKEDFERSLKDLWKICEDLGDWVPSRKWLNKKRLNGKINL